MALSSRPHSSSFSTRKLNRTTFVIREDDIYEEHPLIYAKLHPKADILILSDTGCDEPSEKEKHAHFIHLRDYLENSPLKCNKYAPLNPKGERQYVIICTHCHYDHIGGISQFLEGGTTEIIASGLGRDFIESDLEHHSLFDRIGKPAPYYNVTHWARPFEKLTWPIKHEDEDETTHKPMDLGITFLPTPGHTPDTLGWFDHGEMHLYVGDSIYGEGNDEMPIIWTKEGNIIEWAFSMQKLHYLVRGENARALKAAEEEVDEEDWAVVPKRVKLGCGHQTTAADAEEFFEAVATFWKATMRGKVPVSKKEWRLGDAYYTWREKDGKSGISLQAPAKLMDDARKFFTGTDVMDPDSSAGFL